MTSDKIKKPALLKEKGASTRKNLALRKLEHAMDRLHSVITQLDNLEVLPHSMKHEQKTLYESLQLLETDITTYAYNVLSYFNLMDYVEGQASWRTFNSAYASLCDRYDALCAKCIAIDSLPIEREPLIIKAACDASAKKLTEYKHKLSLAYENAVGAEGLQTRAMRLEVIQILEVMKIDEISENVLKTKWQAEEALNNIAYVTNQAAKEKFRLAKLVEAQSFFKAQADIQGITPARWMQMRLEACRVAETEYQKGRD